MHIFIALSMIFAAHGCSYAAQKSESVVQQESKISAEDLEKVAKLFKKEDPLTNEEAAFLENTKFDMYKPLYGYEVNKISGLPIAAALSHDESPATVLRLLEVLEKKGFRIMYDAYDIERGHWEDSKVWKVNEAFGSIYDPAVVKKLLDLGADPTVKGPNGYTGIHFLVQNKSKEAARVVLDYLVQHNKRDAIDATAAYGVTPLMELLKSMNRTHGEFHKIDYDMLALFKEYGANPFLKEYDENRYFKSDQPGWDVVEYLEGQLSHVNNKHPQALQVKQHLQDLIKDLEAYQKDYKFGVYKAARKPQKEIATEKALQKLSEAERKEAIIIPEQPALRELIVDYIWPIPLTPEDRKSIDKEIKKEQERCVVQ